jgi:hypothetical protein
MPKHIYISDDVLRGRETTEARWKQVLQKWKIEAERQAAVADNETVNNQRMRERVTKANANLELNRDLRSRKKGEKLEIIRQEVIAYRLRNRGHGSASEIANARNAQINAALKEAGFEPYSVGTIAVRIRKIDRDMRMPKK